jgi:hypothetical protein
MSTDNCFGKNFLPERVKNGSNSTGKGFLPITQHFHFIADRTSRQDIAKKMIRRGEKEKPCSRRPRMKPVW